MIEVVDKVTCKVCDEPLGEFIISTKEGREKKYRKIQEHNEKKHPYLARRPITHRVENMHCEACGLKIPNPTVTGRVAVGRCKCGNVTEWKLKY